METIVSASSNLDAKFLFDTVLPNTLKCFQDRIKEIDEIFVFKITDSPDGGTWSLICQATASVVSGAAENAGVTVEMTYESFKTCLSDMHAGIKLYMGGKIAVTGEPQKVRKLMRFFEITRPYSNNI